MSDIYLERLQIMQEFQVIIEKGIYLECRLGNNQVINLYKIDSHYAVTYYCKKKKLITKIDWHKTLTEEQKNMFSLNVDN